MKYSSSATWLCCLALLSSAAVSSAAPVATTAAPDSELKDDAGKTIIHYVVEPPTGLAPANTTDPKRQVGLIICWPEHAHPTGDEIPTVRASLERLKLRNDYVLLAAHTQGEDGKFRDVDHEPLEKLIAWAEKTYPINPRRIYMFGRGEGAKGTGEFGTTHPRLIAAGITYSWGWWKMPDEVEDPIHTAPEFYINLGLKDLAHHLTTVRDTYGRVKAKGYHLIYREFADMGAKTDYPVSNDDALSWMTRQRNKVLPLSPQEAELLHRAASRLERSADPASLADLVLVGGAPAGEVVQRLLSSKNPAIRAEGVEACRRALFGEDTVAALTRCLEDPSPQVREAAFAPLALAANWRSASAQAALIRLALQPRASAADRLHAVDALGEAVKLQKLGVCQDPPMFRALVTLLEDPNETIRTRAFAVLAPIRPSDYQPNAPAAQRTAAVAGWQEWLAQITAKEEAYGKPK